LAALISKTIRDSVSYGLDHREDALKYAMQFARDMETELADQFVGMYVNKWTLGYGEKGKQAVQETHHSWNPKQESSRARTLLSS